MKPITFELENRTFGLEKQTFGLERHTFAKRAALESVFACLGAERPILQLLRLELGCGRGLVEGVAAAIFGAERLPGPARPGLPGGRGRADLTRAGIALN